MPTTFCYPSRPEARQHFCYGGGSRETAGFRYRELLDPEGRASAQTLASERLMTPEYASPEQIRGDQVTTSSDVYSMGVVLYEFSPESAHLN